VTLSRRLRRQKLDQREKPEASEPSAPATLDAVVTPMKRIFPFDFPGQLGDWLKRGPKR
jgi:hypothetical protein